MTRRLRIPFVILLTVALTGYVGGTTFSIAGETDPPHQTHLDHLRGPGMGGGASPCTNCHITGDPGQSDVDFSTCNVCHSPDGAYGWAGEDLKNLFWAAGAYDENGNIRDERWCASCHDKGSSEQRTINGRQAKHVTGDDDGIGGGIYGYFISGHKFLCTSCHDSSLAHIDGYARTYHALECETDPSRTYRMGYRLKLVDGEDPLLVPRVQCISCEAYESSDFRLCYQCHDENRITGYNPIQTYFSNLSTAVGYSGIAPDPPNNFHMELHLLGSKWWDSDLRGETWHSRMSCPTCHDPHSRKAYGSQMHEDHATHSMTRADMGIVYRREVRGWSAWTDSNDFTLPDGDLHCYACHSGSEEEPAGPRSSLYYFLLGTALMDGEDAAFSTRLDEDTDIINLGGVFLGGSFEEYTRNCTTKTGLWVESSGEGCRFPMVGNLNPDQEVIDFWYVPKFDFSSSSGTHFLVDATEDTANFLQIKVVNKQIRFEIKNNGNLYRLRSLGKLWKQDEAHHIVCTWGPSAGMHMYLDRDVEEYNLDEGTGYTEGLNKAMLPDDFYVGRDVGGTAPANGIIDELRLYGYQYQKFEQGPAFFSKLGSYSEIQDPVAGNGGSYGGIIRFRDSNNPPDGYALHILDVDKGVVEFPTSNLNAAGDTIDFWWGPAFDLHRNADTSKHLFYCHDDESGDESLIKVQNNNLRFKIKVGDTSYRVQTVDFPDYAGPEEYNWYTWVHVVCCWGSEGMRIYINGKEAKYTDDSGRSYTGGLGNLPDKFQIGNKTAGGSSYMDSIMDELRIYGYQETEFPQEPEKEWTPHGGPVGPFCFSSGCHAMNKMHAAHFVPDPGPDFPLNETGCYYCHADGRLQCQGRPLFGDDNFLEVTDVCDACHTLGCP